MPDPSDRFRGALVGTAIGDALGSPLEGRARVDQADVDRVLDGTGHARFTDDTAMTLAFARSLADHGDFDADRLAEAFVAAHREEPWRGYGPGPPRVFARIAEGVPWREAARDQYGGGSFGNGGAMRAAPAALIGFGDLVRTADVAAEQAAITHAHPIGRDGAVLQAVTVGVLLTGRGADGPEAVLDTVRPHLRTSEMVDRLAVVHELLAGPDPAEVVNRLGNGITAQEAVPAAVVAALANLGSFAGAVRFALAIGGDTDTIAAMCGALVGAHLGLAAIPRGWQARVEGVDALTESADRIHDLVRP